MRHPETQSADLCGDDEKKAEQFRGFFQEILWLFSFFGHCWFETCLWFAEKMA